MANQYRATHALGDELIDKLTGFNGVVVGVAFYADGSIQYQLQPPICENGKPVEPSWLDACRVVRDGSSGG